MVDHPNFFANRVHVETSSAGTGDLGLGSAISTAYQSFSGASVPDGAEVTYTAYTATQWECGVATYVSAGPTLDRTAANVFAGSDGAATLVNFGSNPRVFIGPLANEVYFGQLIVDAGSVSLCAVRTAGQTESGIFFTGNQTSIASVGNVCATFKTDGISLEGGSKYVNWFPAGGGSADVVLGRTNTAGELEQFCTTALTNSVLNALTIRHETTGTPADNIGSAIVFKQETAAGNIETGATITVVALDTTPTSEDFELQIATMTAGATASIKAKFGPTLASFIANYITLTAAPTYIRGQPFGGDLILAGTSQANSDGLIMLDWNNNAIAMKAACTFGWSSTSDPTATVDLKDSRVAAGNKRIEGITAATNAVQNLLTLRHSTTGTAAAGIGVGVRFEQDTGSDNYEIGVVLEAVTTDVGSGTEDFDYLIKTMAAGAAAAERLRVSANGITPSVRKLEKVTTLTDGATPALDAALGNTFKLVAAGNRTIAVPSNKPASGETQKIVIMHEASGADRTLALTTGSSGAFRFGTDITALSATTNGLVDYIGCIFNQADDRWDVVSYSKGF